ncbi:CYFA0S36e00386g1_1 [Cyberlindnera fabianii]|uniref:UDP-galactose transporter homolog 1 n=1 Tax=Cyberlindnera fabianii TaxID=36022 RepID=A0A061BKV7_CYBFA|nr:CYFA0S36e00386g1_1 [Cyberlindnera fabianii]
MTSHIVLLLVCLVGIYASFLTWGVLQEQISSQVFGKEEERFSAPFVINLAQNVAGFIVGWVYVVYQNSQVSEEQRVSAFDLSLLKSVTLVALTQSLSSPIGLSSVQHVDYLLYQLAKSCKLIPVMLIHLTVYRAKFPFYKYAVAGSVTLGVMLFSIAGSSKSSKNSSNEGGNLTWGLILLCTSLLLDGITNAEQDSMFKKNTKLTGAHLQCALNFVSFGFTLFYASVMTNQLQYAIDFISRYPSILREIALYAVCGAIGQIFIFVTLANFGSIVLITVTVTRKMMSMLLSVVIFGHDLQMGQWIALGLVFGGIGYEAWVKLQQSKKTKQVAIDKKEK